MYQVFVDLGAHFWLDIVRFLNDGVGGIDELALQVVDGTLAPDGSFDWTQVLGIEKAEHVDQMLAGASLVVSREHKKRLDHASERFSQGMKHHDT